MSNNGRSYAEKLKDPRWQRKRLEVLSRDDWKCQKCGGTDKNLHVHHLAYVYGKDPWEYAKSDLTTLCHSCHETEFKISQEIKRLSDLLRQYSQDPRDVSILTDILTDEVVNKKPRILVFGWGLLFSSLEEINLAEKGVKGFLKKLRKAKKELEANKEEENG